MLFVKKSFKQYFSDSALLLLAPITCKFMRDYNSTSRADSFAQMIWSIISI